MIVRRLNALYRRIVAQVIVVIRAFTRQTPTPVGVPHTVGQAVSGSPPPRQPGHTRTNWLADAHRLRTRPPPPTSIARPSAEAVRQIMRDPHWASAFDASRMARPPRVSNPLDTRSLPEGSEAAPTRPLTSPSTTPDAGAEADDAQRRLTLMRDLVRRGLYNEGFMPKDTPDYYRSRPIDTDQPPSLPPAD